MKRTTTASRPKRCARTANARRRSSASSTGSSRAGKAWKRKRRGLLQVQALARHEHYRRVGERVDLGGDARRIEHDRRGPVAAGRVRRIEARDLGHRHVLAALAAPDHRGQPREQLGARDQLAFGLARLVFAEKKAVAGGGFGVFCGISRGVHPRRMLSLCPPRGGENRRITSGAQSSTSSAFWNLAWANSCSEPMASATFAPYAGASSISCSPSASRSCLRQM